MLHYTLYGVKKGDLIWDIKKLLGVQHMYWHGPAVWGEGNSK